MGHDQFINRPRGLHFLSPECELIVTRLRYVPLLGLLYIELMVSL